MDGSAPPPSVFREDFLDLETAFEPHPVGLRRTQSLQERVARRHGQRTMTEGKDLYRTSTDLRGALFSALKSTSSLKTRLSRGSGAKEVLTALQKTASGDFREASIQVEHAWRRFERGYVAHAIARFLVCLFFIDRCYAKYRNWEYYQTAFWQDRIARYPFRYKDPGFPYLAIFLTLPCALMTIFGICTRLAAGILVLDMLRETSGIMFAGMLRVVQHRIEPDELTAKHVAMLGSSFLILAHAVRDRYTTSNTVAGLLIGEPNSEPSRLKSLVLLFSRLALTLLFITVGVAQVKRVVQRDWAMVAKRDFLRPDGHDNSFLLLEAGLAVPFALGLRTHLVSPLLALTLLAEAVFCWWPLESWPSVQYQSHVRNHFATNLGAAGGLLLLQTYGAGQYTMDGLLRTKKNL